MDNGQPIYVKKGYNTVNLSHFLLRSNAGLPEGPSQNGEEVKHNYSIQAVFDKDLWPECKTVNAETDDISWIMKWFTSETVAVIKDTDKEDKEKALKQSWESAEPGRAEKAAKSRSKFLAQQKQARGE